MDEALKQSQIEAIQELQISGLVDFIFRECYSLKDDSNPRFFLDLISTFTTDAANVLIQMTRCLRRKSVDFSEMNEHYAKLKGSAASIGACCITGKCSDLRIAIQGQSKEGCLEALINIKREFRRLKSRLKDIIEIEDDLITIND